MAIIGIMDIGAEAAGADREESPDTGYGSIRSGMYGVVKADNYNPFITISNRYSASVSSKWMVFLLSKNAAILSLGNEEE